MNADPAGDADAWFHVLALASAPTWADVAEVLASQPVELSARGEGLLLTVGFGAMQRGDRDTAEALLNTAALVTIARESGPADAVREVTARGLPRTVPALDVLGRLRVEGFRLMREDAVAATLPALSTTGPDSGPALVAAARCWVPILRHPQFVQLPAELVASTARTATELCWLAFAATGDVDLLDVIATAERAAVTGAPDGSPEQGEHLTALARALHQRFALTGDATALDEAIDAYGRALCGVPAAGPDVVQEAGNAHRERYVMSGDPDDLDRATELHRAAVAAAQAGSAAPAHLIGELGSDLRLRYERTNRRDDLDEAVDALSWAVRAASPDDPFRSALQANLGNALRDRYERTSDVADLDAATELHRDAVATSGPDGPWTLPHALGIDLRDRYRRTGDAADRDEALRWFDTALGRVGRADSGHPMVLMDRGVVLMDSYGSTGSARDVHAAVRDFREAVAATPHGSPGLPRRLLNLASALQTRYGLDGDAATLDDALGILARASASDPAPSDLVMITATRGFLLDARYDVRGDAADLDRAVADLEDALALGPHPANRVWVLTTLGGALRRRYARTTRINDLDRACTALREAADAPDADAPTWANRANNLAVALLERYGLLHGPADLDDAAARLEEAGTRLDPTAPDLPAVLTTLGAVLAERHDGPAGGPDDLVRALSNLRRAAELTPSGSTHRPRRLSSLGGILLAWYDRTREPRFLDDAMATFREAVDEVPADAPDRAAYLRNLAVAQRKRYARSRDPQDLDAAVSTLRRCCTIALEVDTASALDTGRSWGDWAVGRSAWLEAAEAYGIALRAAEHAFGVQMLRSEKETWLRRTADLGERAAHATAAAGDPRSAADSVERGRALLLSEMLQLVRADVRALADGPHARLARRFEDAAREWIDLAPASDPAPVVSRG